MNFPALTFLVAAFAATSCANNHDRFLHGNPQLRAMQEQQVRDLVGNTEKTRRLREFVSKRTVDIRSLRDDSKEISRGNLHIGGRAAAISSDGYFLTAYHVTENPPIIIQDIVFTEEFEERINVSQERGEKAVHFNSRETDEFVKVEHYEGRVVWYDSDSDLALLKFERETEDYFDLMEIRIVLGQVVVSADNSGYVKGNTDYFCAGQIVRLGEMDSGNIFFESDMIARKGMSGGAAVTLEGNLCGILSKINAPHLKERRSYFFFPRKGLLQEIIRRDRNSNRVEQCVPAKSDRAGG